MTTTGVRVVTPVVEDVVFEVADAQHRAQGLIAWVRLRTGGLLVGGLALRERRHGGLVVTWPERIAKDGRRHSVTEPEDMATRRAIDAAIMAAWPKAEGQAP